MQAGKVVPDFMAEVMQPDAERTAHTVPSAAAGQGRALRRSAALRMPSAPVDAQAQRMQLQAVVSSMVRGHLRSEHTV